MNEIATNIEIKSRAPAFILVFAMVLYAAAAQAQSARDPVTITSVTRSNGQMTIYWEGAIPPYKLQKRTDTTTWVDCTYHIYAQSYVVPLSTGTFFYRVRTVADTLAPQVPSGLSGIANRCDRITLSWTALACPDQRWCGDNAGGTGLRGYRIYRDGAFVREVSTPLQTAVDPGLSASRSYSYAISSVDRAGNESAQSSAIVVSTPACADGGSVTLAWDPNPESDVGGYILRYGASSGAYTNAVNVGNLTTATVESLQAGRTYFFAVYAYNTFDLESDPSNEVSYTP